MTVAIAARGSGSHARWALGVLATVLFVTASGCSDAVVPCDTPVPVAGTWAYQAQQTAPASATITGTLRFSGTACGQFTGSLDASVLDASGGTARIAGDVSGSLVDSTTVEFDVLLPGRSRQHLAVLRSDSLKGDWFEPSAGGASGSFVARRVVTP